MPTAEEATPPAGAVTDSSVQNPPVPATSAAEPPKVGDPDWLNGRIAQAKKSAEAEMLKALGVDSLDSAKGRIEAAKKLEDERKTETERANERIKALEPEALRAKTLESIVAGRVAAELAAMTDAQRALVVSLAGDEPSAQIVAIDKLRAGGAFAPPAAVTNAKPPVAPPASTSGAGAAPVPASPTAPNHKATYESLQKTNPIAASAYALRYEREVFGG